MKIFGSWTELVKLSFRTITGNKVVDVQPAAQSGSSPVALTIPDVGDSADTFVLNDTAATLTNKSLSDSTTAVVDVTDSTKQIKFDAGGTASTSTTIAAAQTADRTLTLPDVTGTILADTNAVPVSISVNSASDALRVTQTGAGNALVVQDESPEATPTVIDTEGRIVTGATASIGTVAAGTPITPRIQVHGTTNSTSATSQTHWNSNSPYLTLNRANSGTIGTHSTPVTNGNTVGIIQFNGSDGTQFKAAAQLIGYVDSNDAVSTGIVPGTFQVTTTDHTGLLRSRLTITSQGRTILGNNPATGGALTTAAAKLYIDNASYTDNVTAAGATVAAMAAFSGIQIPSLIGSNGTLGNEVTYTNASTLWIEGAPTAGTNTAITNPWAVYIQGGKSRLASTLIVETGTNNALEVRNTGTGHSFVVEDSTNPDSTPFIIDDNGRVLKGYTARIPVTYEADGSQNSTSGIQSSGVGAAITPSTALIHFANSTTNTRAPQLTFGRTQGTSQTDYKAATNGNELGVVSFQGGDGEKLIRAAKITATVDTAENIVAATALVNGTAYVIYSVGNTDFTLVGAADNNIGTKFTATGAGTGTGTVSEVDKLTGRLSFATSSNTSSTPTERMRIDSEGKIMVGSGAPTAGSSIHVSKTMTGSTTTRGVYSAGTVQTDSTTVARYFQSLASTAADASPYTITGIAHFYASQGTLGANSTVTSQYGFAVESTLTGATNNYAFYSNIAAATGRWNFYASGTAANFFGGDVQTNGFQILGKSTLTIASGAVTATRSFHLIAGEGGVADTLSTINGGTDGAMLIIRASSDTVDITVDEAGNIALSTASFVLNSNQDTLTLIYDSGVAKWLEVSRSDNN